MNKHRSDDLHRYIRTRWKQRSLRTYAFISRLKNDSIFRKEWIKRRAQKDDLAHIRSPAMLLNGFLQSLELKQVVNAAGKPVIRILPRRYQGHSCHSLLDTDMKHITTFMALAVDEAAGSIIHGYNIVNVLGSLFGEEYRKMLNQYVIGKMQERIGKQNGR